MAKLLIFNEKVEKISGFLIVYKLFTRTKIRNDSVEKQM